MMQDNSPGERGREGAPEPSTTSLPTPHPLRFYGGVAGALAPFAVFLAGVAWLGLSGAPDERGFWPILLAGLMTGMLLTRDRAGYSEAVVRGMAQPILALMIMAWLLAGVLASVINAAGFVDALIGLAGMAHVGPSVFSMIAFLVCALVSTSTGTSLGTLILCAPLLYPAGALLGADPAWLMGAIIGGATFGDNISPVSDTTIASASTQGADIGGVVRSRIRYALPAAVIALGVVAVMAGGGPTAGAGAGAPVTPVGPAAPNLAGLSMILVPVLVIGMLLRGRHLVESLLFGILAATVLGLATRTISPGEFLYIDPDAFLARGLILDGFQRGIGVSVFTLLLMGLVGGLEASGVVDRVVKRARSKADTPRAAEWSMFAAVSAAVLLTTHSVVAILTAGPLARETGEAVGVSPYRRANILDVTVCTYPFLLPFFVPVILAASLTAGGAELGVPRVSPLDVGLHNVHSWALLAVILAAIATGWGRERG